jgi:sulfate permease, SulP family
MQSPSYMTSKTSFARDLPAGLAVAGLILPEAIAYSGIANLPPMAGILSACIGLIIYALAGHSRFAIAAATSSSAVVLAASIRSLQIGNAQHVAEMAAGLVLLTGVLFCVCSLLDLGRMAHFIARPVVRGLAFGLAIVITIKQLVLLTGIEAGHSNAPGMLWDLLRQIGHWHVQSLALGLSALALLIALRKLPHLPGPLLIIVGGIVINHWLINAGQSLAVVGPISLSAIRFSIPDIQLDDWLRLGELSVALTLILFAESYSAIRVFALKHDDTINTNRELFALGLVNLFAGLFHAMPIGAGYSATAANEASGARTRKASLFAGLLVTITAFLLLNFVAQIPLAILAAIIIYAMRHVLDIKPLRVYFKWQRDQLVVIVAVLAVLIFGVLDGLLAAIAASLILLIKGLAEPRLTRLGQLGQGHDYVNIDLHPDVHTPDHVLILRPEAPLFFANVSALLEKALTQTLAEQRIRTVILSLEETPDIDGTTIEALEQFAQRLTHNKRSLMFARLKTPVIAALTQAKLPALHGATLSEDSVATVVALANQNHVTS